MPATTPFRSSTFGWRTCRRLKARSCRVSDRGPVARLPDLLHAPCAAPDFSPSWLCRSSLYPLITVSRLLKSWATPPASRPTASIFCDWRSCSSSFLRSVTLSNTATKNPFPGAVHGYGKPDLQGIHVDFRPLGLTGKSHPSVELEQLRVGLADAGDDVGHPFPDDILQSRQLLEGGVHVEVHEVPELPVLDDHLAIRVPFEHVLEQRTVPLFAEPERLVGPELRQRDRHLVRQVLEQGDPFRRETPSALVVELEEAEGFLLRAEGDEGHRFVSLAVAAIAGFRLPVGFRRARQQFGRAARPEAAARGEERLGGIEPPAEDVAAHAIEGRMTRARREPISPDGSIAQRRFSASTNSSGKPRVS